MVRVRTCEEKIESDDYGEKRGEPEGIIEKEVTHEEVGALYAARPYAARQRNARADIEIHCGVCHPARATMYHLLKGLHEYLTRFATRSRFSLPVEIPIL